MPFVEVTIGDLPESRKRELAVRLTELFVAPGVPPEWVTIVFHHIRERDYARGGRFPYWREARGTREGGQRPTVGVGIVDVTIGGLEEAEKRRIAVGVSRALVDAGVAEGQIEIHFRHVTGRDVAEGGGNFPFRPPGSKW